MFDNSDVVLRTGLVSGEDRLLGPPIDGGKPRRVAVVRQRGSVASTPRVVAWVPIGLISGNSTLEPPIGDGKPRVVAVVRQPGLVGGPLQQRRLLRWRPGLQSGSSAETRRWNLRLVTVNQGW